MADGRIQFTQTAIDTIVHIKIIVGRLLVISSIHVSFYFFHIERYDIFNWMFGERIGRKDGKRPKNDVIKQWIWHITTCIKQIKEEFHYGFLSKIVICVFTVYKWMTKICKIFLPLQLWLCTAILNMWFCFTANYLNIPEVLFLIFF